MNKRILMIDDDRALCELTRDYLKQFNFQLTIERTPSAAHKRLTDGHFAAAIVDVMMPEMDGFELVRRLRAAAVRLPIIMLTARADVADRVVGLESGADDYLPKPFEPRELAARLLALTRRHHSPDAQPLHFNGLRLFPAAQRAEIQTAPTAPWRDLLLTTGEFRALTVLAEARPAAVSRDELSARLRGLVFDVADRSLDITISRLRAKLGDSAKSSRFIKTIRNSGYAFIAEEQAPNSPD